MASHVKRHYLNDPSFIVKSKDVPRKYDRVAAVCFDGGGARVVASAIILRSILDDLDGELRKDTTRIHEAGPHETGAIRVSQSEVHEHFHIAAGAHAGGFMALLLGRLRSPIHGVVEFYNVLARKLSLKFGDSGQRTWVQRLSLNMGLLDKVFQEEALKFILASTKTPETPECNLKSIGETKRNQDDCAGRAGALLYDATEDSFPVCIVGAKRSGQVDNSADLGLTNRKLQIFRSYHPNDANITTLEVARATCATSSRWKHIFGMNDRSGSNNPTRLLINEIFKHFGCGVQLTPLISFGIGVTEGTDADRTHLQITRLFEKYNIGTYIRINVPGLEEFAEEDYLAIPDIVKRTQEYLDSKEGKDIVSKAVQCLQHGGKQGT